MTSNKGLVLDANILIRAVLGQRVLDILITYQTTAHFYCPDRCFEDARKYLPRLCAKQKLDPDKALATIE